MVWAVWLLEEVTVSDFSHDGRLRGGVLAS
jgi:hypothetical protein